jgi:hypothetical protein
VNTKMNLVGVAVPQRLVSVESVSNFETDL